MDTPLGTERVGWGNFRAITYPLSEPVKAEWGPRGLKKGKYGIFWLEDKIFPPI